MERYRKRDMLQTVDTLLRANDAIVRNFRSNQQGTTEVLVQCQESAIALGNCLETFGETYTRLVQILEGYCENIYQMSESLSDENLCRKLSKKIQKQLTTLQNGIKYDMPEDKKEVVFLPYKASMWDSLESVWRAADADPDCDAYVIPIPYFDKNPDGSFKEEHYEGDLYPKDVPVTRYDEYDLEARHPDIIYIHNPYDDCNHVTSVHPYFYSKNLRKFTDRLVYIPYFVLGEIDPGDQTTIDGMKHFCFMPGTLYADRVIVQSENMRQIYINEYIKAAKQMGLGGEHVDRKFLEKKFLGTGSPKIDKVLNTKKEDLEIPDEWLKIIRKPDGSWKKIVFYNTSVSALLQHDEKMLKKMESVFEIFKENRDEVALLWRPHPLIQATIESMRPQLWESYMKIRDRYIEEGWGIYDDSADVDRAVVISDAYYGDGSSVVQLCQKKQIPRLLQVMECRFEENNKFFLVSYLCNLTQNQMILVSWVTNAVLLISKRDWSLEKVYAFNHEKYKESLYLSAFCDGEKVIGIPYNADEFRVLHLQTGEQKKIVGCISDIDRNVKEKFLTTVTCGGRLWAVGEKIKRIIGIEIDTLEVVSNTDFAQVKGLEDIADKIVWGSGYVIRGDFIFLASRNYGVVLSVNCLTGEAVVCAKLSDVEGFSYFYEYQKQLILIDQTGCEYLYDMRRAVITKTGKEFDDACWKCIVMGEKRYYFEAFSGEISCIDKDKTTKILYENVYDSAEKKVKFQFVERDGKYIYFQERFSGQIFMLDTNTNECVQQKINVLSYAEKWKKRTIEENRSVACNEYTENSFYHLKDLLRYLHS